MLRKFGKKMTTMSGVPHGMANRPMKQTSIDFKSRELPRTILVDVKSDIVYLGCQGKIIGECDQLHPGHTINSNRTFLKQLEDFGKERFEKIILDNGDGFKILEFNEFIDAFRFNIKKANQKMNKLFVTDEIEHISNIKLHPSGRIFFISSKDGEMTLKSTIDFTSFDESGFAFEEPVNNIVITKSGNIQVCYGYEDKHITAFDQQLNIIGRHSIDAVISFETIVDSKLCIIVMAGAYESFDVIIFENDDLTEITRKTFNSDDYVIDNLGICEYGDGYAISIIASSIHKDPESFENILSILYLDKELNIISSKNFDSDKVEFSNALMNVNGNLCVFGYVINFCVEDEQRFARECTDDSNAENEQRLAGIIRDDHIDYSYIDDDRIFDTIISTRNGIVTTNENFMDEDIHDTISFYDVNMQHIKTIKLAGVKLPALTCIDSFGNQLIIANISEQPFLAVTDITMSDHIFLNKDNLVQFEEVAVNVKQGSLNRIDTSVDIIAR